MNGYRFVRAVAVVYSKLFHRLSVKGTENIPQDGGCVIIANHSSFLDPIFVASSFKRDIFFMGKSDLLKSKFMKWIFNLCHVIPINRGESDIAALRKTCDVVNGGNLTGIFPQGTRIRCNQPEVETVQAGIGLVGARTKAPIIPVAICYGKKNLCPKVFRKVTVSIGKPMNYEEYALQDGERKTSQEMAAYAFTKVCDLFAENNHG